MLPETWPGDPFRSISRISSRFHPVFILQYYNTKFLNVWQYTGSGWVSPRNLLALFLVLFLFPIMCMYWSEMLLLIVWSQIFSIEDCSFFISTFNKFVNRSRLWKCNCRLWKRMQTKIIVGQAIGDEDKMERKVKGIWLRRQSVLLASAGMLVDKKLVFALPRRAVVAHY